jgi:hypothetical protein
MSGVYSTYGEGRGMFRVLWGNVMERDYWRDPGVDGRIILMWIFKMWDVGGKDWTDLAQDCDRWRAFVNAVMNIRFP